MQNQAVLVILQRPRRPVSGHQQLGGMDRQPPTPPMADGGDDVHERRKEFTLNLGGKGGGGLLKWDEGHWT